MEFMVLHFILILLLNMWPVSVDSVGRMITNPRQVRADPDPNNQEQEKKMVYLTEFVITNAHRLVDIGRPCDERLHRIWEKKDIFSGDKETSFAHSTEWHKQICNFFKYLDCVKQEDGREICVCAAESKYKLRLKFEPADGYNSDAVQRKGLKRKTRCRVEENELCNFVRIQPGSFPGVNDIAVPDFFECMKPFVCATYVDNQLFDPITKRPVVSEKCQNESAVTKVRNGVGNVRSAIALVSIFPILAIAM